VSDGQAIHQTRSSRAMRELRRRSRRQPFTERLNPVAIAWYTRMEEYL
jgi:hypothetical protein